MRSVSVTTPARTDTEIPGDDAWLPGQFRKNGLLQVMVLSIASSNRSYRSPRSSVCCAIGPSRHEALGIVWTRNLANRRPAQTASFTGSATTGISCRSRLWGLKALRIALAREISSAVPRAMTRNPSAFSADS
jgi:hypothetical protein